MRIHTTLGKARVCACVPAGVGLERINKHGSRSHDHAFDIILSGSGRRGGQWGNRSDAKAATWDEWGNFLARLFDADPDAKAGPYVDAEHFRWSTNNRYPTEHDCSHKWMFEGWSPSRVYYVQRCTKCEEARRFLERDHVWEEVSCW